MRRVLFVFAIITTLVFQGCVGPEGPQGPPGASTIGGVKDVTVTFIPNNGFKVAVPLPYRLYNSDVLLAYEMSGIENGNPIWTALPSTYYVNGGEIRYFFDYTANDVVFYLDTDLPPAAVPIQFSNNKTFRIVMLPGNFVSDVDVTNFDSVINKLNQ